MINLAERALHWSDRSLHNTLKCIYTVMLAHWKLSGRGDTLFKGALHQSRAKKKKNRTLASDSDTEAMLGCPPKDRAACLNSSKELSQNLLLWLKSQ